MNHLHSPNVEAFVSSPNPIHKQAGLSSECFLDEKQWWVAMNHLHSHNVEWRAFLSKNAAQPAGSGHEYGIHWMYMWFCYMLVRLWKLKCHSQHLLFTSLYTQNNQKQVSTQTAIIMHLYSVTRKMKRCVIADNFFPTNPLHRCPHLFLLGSWFLLNHFACHPWWFKSKPFQFFGRFNGSLLLRFLIAHALLHKAI